MTENDKTQEESAPKKETEKSRPVIRSIRLTEREAKRMDQVAESIGLESEQTLRLAARFFCDRIERDGAEQGLAAVGASEIQDDSESQAITLADSSAIQAVTGVDPGAETETPGGMGDPEHVSITRRLLSLAQRAKEAHGAGKKKEEWLEEELVGMVTEMQPKGKEQIGELALAASNVLKENLRLLTRSHLNPWES